MDETFRRALDARLAPIFRHGSTNKILFVSPDIYEQTGDEITGMYGAVITVRCPEHWKDKLGVIVGWDLTYDRPDL